ncbi:MAG: hypothetical protein U5N86_02140 [Planctomycetota bacterium]|nr:hypothetical protein [Planctomycetota bacterium]
MHELVLPAIDDELAKKHNYDDIEELEMDLRLKLEDYKRQNVERKYRDTLMDKLAELADFDVPENLLREQATRSYDRQRMEYMRMGLDIEKMEDGKHADSLKAAALENAERAIKLHFIVDKIAESENLFVTESEFRREIELLANRQGVSLQKMLKVVQEKNLEEQIRFDLLERKVFDLVEEHAEVEEVESLDSELTPEEKAAKAESGEEDGSETEE